MNDNSFELDDFSLIIDEVPQEKNGRSLYRQTSISETAFSVEWKTKNVENNFFLNCIYFNNKGQSVQRYYAKEESATTLIYNNANKNNDNFICNYIRFGLKSINELLGSKNGQVIVNIIVYQLGTNEPI